MGLDPSGGRVPAPHDVRARSFDGWPVEYDRYRPSYPPPLFDLVAERLSLPPAASVADLGAGTGKAALAMAARGWQVTAVEPGAAMLAVLRERAADRALEIATVSASAEETGLSSAAFDLATAAEAYHWFDAPRALQEVGRIVRPGGGFACFWNVRDVDASQLLADFDALGSMVGAEAGDLRRPGPREETRAEIRATALFDEPSFVQVKHEVPMTGGEFIGLAFTTSHVRTAPPFVQAAFRQELEKLLARHGIDATTAVALPYVVDCWIATRSAAEGRDR